MSQEKFEIPNDAPQIGAIHSHYKNPDKHYQVTGMSLNSDSSEWYVEYVPLYEGAAATKFNRSLASWLNPEIIEGQSLERYPFVKMGE